MARAIGMDPASYEQAERTGKWTGDARQSAALASVLSLSARDRLTATGHDDRLAELRGRRPRPAGRPTSAVAKLTGIDKRTLEEPLRTMHQEYQRLIAATLSRAGGSAASGEQGRVYLDQVLDHF
ncbi:hypothetical protein [Streptomyces sp. KL116D]|uniref:hypothetical protein n=1 Tax=Streptomyces sp. KL116D TaxID=3045152 RepID=UPI003558FA30